MKNYIFLLLAALTQICCQNIPTLKALKKYAAVEKFNEDLYLMQVKEKRAMVIVAHDDDDCAMSGTIAKLSAQGWKIKQISFQAHASSRSDIKQPSELLYVAHEYLSANQPYRFGLDTMKVPYLPIPLKEIERQFPKEVIRAELLEKINSFQPKVLFSLDDIKGGYGHPDHVFISQLTAELFRNGETKAERLYQSVFTDHMEIEIVDKRLASKLKKWGFPNASDIANEMYGIDGMPEPTTQITITDVADLKMEYLRAYDEDVKKNLRKFLPYFEDFSASDYFGLFDREFFRVIQL